MKLTVGPSLAALRAAARTKIDTEAEASRAQWLTPGAGQALEYAKTAAEADLYMTAYEANGNSHPDGNWPILMAETDALGASSSPPNYVAAATLILARRDDSDYAMADIKRRRRAAKVAVAAATTVAGINAAAVVTWPESRFYLSPGWLRWPFTVTRDQL